MSDTDARRAARRAAMPIVSALVAEYARFNPKVIYAHENGITVGKRPVYVEVFDIPPNYFPTRAAQQQERKDKK